MASGVTLGSNLTKYPKIEAAVEVIDLVVCLFASLDFGCVDPNLEANRSMDDLLVRHLQ